MKIRYNMINALGRWFLFFGVMLSAVSVVSCSGEDEMGATPESSGRKVLFSVSDGTRATSYDALAGTVSMYGYHFTGSWDASGVTPSYMNGVTGTISGGSLLPSGDYYWPSSGKLRVYAFGNCPSVTATNGAPSFSYTNPTSSADQRDLQVGQSDEDYDCATGGMVGITFRHALSGLRFKAARGTIKSVAFTGIPSTATYTVGTGWGTASTPVNYPASSNMEYLMIPQTLPAGAVLTVVITDETGNDHSFDYALGKEGIEWKANTYYEYTVNARLLIISSISIDGWGSGDGENNGATNNSQIDMDGSVTSETNDFGSGSSENNGATNDETDMDKGSTSNETGDFSSGTGMDGGKAGTDSTNDMDSDTSAPSNWGNGGSEGNGATNSETDMDSGSTNNSVTGFGNGGSSPGLARGD